MDQDWWDEALDNDSDRPLDSDDLINRFDGDYDED